MHRRCASGANFSMVCAASLLTMLSALPSEVNISTMLAWFQLRRSQRQAESIMQVVFTYIGANLPETMTVVLLSGWLAWSATAARHPPQDATGTMTKRCGASGLHIFISSAYQAKTSVSVVCDVWWQATIVSALIKEIQVCFSFIVFAYQHSFWSDM